MTSCTDPTDGILQAAAAALSNAAQAGGRRSLIPPWGFEIDATTATRVMLEAVEPLIEAKVRRQAAAELVAGQLPAAAATADDEDASMPEAPGAFHGWTTIDESHVHAVQDLDGLADVSHRRRPGQRPTSPAEVSGSGARPSIDASAAAAPGPGAVAELRALYDAIEWDWGVRGFTDLSGRQVDLWMPEALARECVAESAGNGNPRELIRRPRFSEPRVVALNPQKA